MCQAIQLIHNEYFPGGGVMFEGIWLVGVGVHETCNSELEKSEEFQCGKIPQTSVL